MRRHVTGPPSPPPYLRSPSPSPLQPPTDSLAPARNPVIGMNCTNFIDLSSDEESEEAQTDNVKTILPLSVHHDKTPNSASKGQLCYRDCSIKQEPEESRTSNSSSSITDQGSPSANEVCPNFASPSPLHLCRQFWRSGDYEVGQSISPISQTQKDGHNRLHIHPKFLRSNATSHKWAFGAIAELIDNAMDEAQNGATFVTIEKFTNPRDGSNALLIQDDGGGMDLESLHRCMSFGFSEKQSSSIGQYGNGFKTSTMRLGADAIVFSCCKKERLITQSVGLLSYTFLIETGSDDIVVPIVGYAFDPLTDSFKRLYRNTQKQYSSNLSTVLQWSPFTTEAKLLEQFSDIGQHGTKIIVFNLWLNDDGDMEIDFQSDEKDIMIHGAQRKVLKNNSIEKNYVAHRLQYSLRAYISILYLRIPKEFKIVLRGEVVESHYIANDLIYRECIRYRPQVGGVTEANIMTTIGFLEGAPDINVHGFNVYHKNRLILPFLKVANNSYRKGRGVVGVLEANFIKPTHDKQDFEKSVLYQRLETRLREMTYEYWDLHSHLVGYTNRKNHIAGSPASLVCQMPQLETSNSPHQVKSNCSLPLTPNGMPVTNFPLSSQVFSSISAAEFRYSTKRDVGKGKHEGQVALIETTKVLALPNAAGSGSANRIQQDSSSGRKPNLEIKSMILENKKLRDECLEYEEMEQQLMQKANKLRNELLDIQEAYKKLLIDIESMDALKMEKS